jgi:hypothetical protein
VGEDGSRRDPEADLAALVSDPDQVSVVCEAWESASGRVADRARTCLYAWLLAEEAGSESEEWQNAYGALDPPDGGRKTTRVIPKDEFKGRYTPEVPLWESLADGVDGPVRAALAAHGVDAGSSSLGFRMHACNDVVRLDALGGPCVVKVFNKPVWGPLFELEAFLEARLGGTAATVLAPLRLPSGVCAFRVAGRPAAVYPYVGDARLGTALVDLGRQARAQAALNAVEGAAEAFPEIGVRSDDLPLELLMQTVGPALDSSDREALAATWWRTLGRIEAAPPLPTALVHGSFHRDHAGWSPDHGVVVFDLEKISLGARLRDVVASATYAGYRGNDEKADPARIVTYLREVHRVSPFSSIERDAAADWVIYCLLKDARSLAQDAASVDRIRAHVAVLADFVRNRDNLHGAITRYLD